MRFLALALVVTLASLALGEWVLRGAGVEPAPPPPKADEGADWGQPDRVLGWTNRPGTGHSNEPGHVAMTFWPDGQRASSSTSDRRAGRTVLLMGCSYTAGLGVADDETFAWRLNERFPDLRFENYGVPAYGTYQSLLLLEQLLRGRGQPPELVVYGFIGDHVRRNAAPLSWLRQLRSSRGLYEVPPHVTLEGDGLAEHPPGVIAAWPLEHQSAMVRALHDLSFGNQPNRGRWNLLATHRLLERMNREVEEAGSRLLVAVLDDLPPRTEAFLAEGRIAFVDCREPAFHRDPELQIGQHPSAKLHALWSECLSRALAAQGLLPAPPSGR